jgi:hypothetical protein
VKLCSEVTVLALWLHVIDDSERWQFYGETAAAASLARYADLGPMGDTDRLHDRKSQGHTTQIAASRLVGPEKALEDMRESASGNSCAVIRYFQDGRARLSANPDFDRRLPACA